MLFYNPRFKLYLAEVNMRAKRGGPYYVVVHDVFSAKAVEIMDVKGSHFMVTLKFLLEHDQVPIHLARV
jgi:hypothetical protein